MPVPDPPVATLADPEGGAVGGHFHFVEADHVNIKSPSTANHPCAYPTTTSQSFERKCSTEILPHANGTSFTSLKAVPLSSYYRLHRVPSPAAMSEADSGTDDTQAVKLPRRESTTEAPEQVPRNGLHNKLLEQVVRTPGRQPSPQPTHLSVPGSGQPRVLHEQGSGYVAPIFEGKESQMEEGRPD